MLTLEVADTSPIFRYIEKNDRMIVTASSNMTLVNNSTITKFDVLFGRGTHCSCHVGSIAFKAVVVATLDPYLKATSQHGKTRLTADIIEAVHRSGGRFLAKMEQQKADDSTGCTNVDEASWYEVDKMEARIKIRDTLRDCIKSARKKGCASALIDRAGLSGIFSRNSPFRQIVEHVEKSSAVSMYVRGRNDLSKDRSRRLSPQTVRKHTLDAAPGFSNSMESQDTVVYMESPAAAAACYSPAAVTQRKTAPVPLVHVQRSKSSLSVSQSQSSKTQGISTLSQETNLMLQTAAQEKSFISPTPLRPAHLTPSSDQNMLDMQYPWMCQQSQPPRIDNDNLLNCDNVSQAQHHLISPLIYNYARCDNGDNYLTFPPSPPLPSLENLMLLDDDEECGTSKMINRAIALSREGDGELLDYCFSRTTAQVLRNKERRADADRCSFCNEAHDADIWSDDEVDSLLI